MTAVLRRWDIFCTVVDHFGDAGVSWRLARLLAAEHGREVTLWLDRLAALARIAPGVDPQRAAQTVAGVAIRAAPGTAGEVAPADVVIDAFGGGLPNAYADAMAKRHPPPAWIILEYLSAEPWVEAAHDRASPHPTLPLARRFWFPGFTRRTGGLLRERGLFAARDAFRADAGAQRELWTRLGMPMPHDDQMRVSLFCYANPALPALLEAWAEGDAKVVVAVPQGVAGGALDAWAGGALPHPGGAPLERGRLQLHVVPFVAQDEYDRLLWACDVNFVRGEDSFVRAQWAARPFVWQLYPQDNAAHLPKLDAFLDRYGAKLDRDCAQALRRLMAAWNGAAAAPPVESAWADFAARAPALRRHGERWVQSLAELPELAAGLVRAAETGL